MNESQNIEWKKSWRDEYIKWICGFANAKGGRLLIGKNDQGKVTGIDDAEQLLEEIPNKVRDLLGILVDVNLLNEDGKDTLEIIVEAYPYPVSLRGRYYYRSGSTKQELKGAALDRFLLEKQGKRWDGVPIPDVSVDDLKAETYIQFKNQATKSKRVSQEILGDNHSVLIDNLRLRDGAYLKRAAILLFHSDPEYYVTGAYIKIGFFAADDDLRYQDEVHGNLFEQVVKTFDLLLTKYLKAEIRYEGANRIEEYPYPEAALREALLNAIAHKDYSSNTPIQISVYDDKIMFWNNGQLPENWTVENLLQKHPSRPFNPDIANALFRAGLVESWGRGIDTMVNACRKYGTPPPALRYDKSDFWVEFSAKTTLVTTQKTTQKILSILSEYPLAGRRKIAEMLGDITEDGVKYHLAKMTKQGQIKRVGPAKGGYWQVLEEKES